MCLVKWVKSQVGDRRAAEVCFATRLLYSIYLCVHPTLGW
jgi:hypothetical protein